MVLYITQVGMADDFEAGLISQLKPPGVFAETNPPSFKLFSIRLRNRTSLKVIV
jgi:hypothetical protein